MKPLEQQLAELKEQLSGHFDNAAKEQKALGTVLEKLNPKYCAAGAGRRHRRQTRGAQGCEVPSRRARILQANDSVNA